VFRGRTAVRREMKAVRGNPVRHRSVALAPAVDEIAAEVRRSEDDLADGLLIEAREMNDAPPGSLVGINAHFGEAGSG
jgi:hypothetical protein